MQRERKQIVITNEQHVIAIRRPIGRLAEYLQSSEAVISENSADAFTPEDIEGIIVAGVRRQLADGPRGRMAIVADCEHLHAVARAYASAAAARDLPPVSVFSTPDEAHAWLDEAALA